MHLGSRPSVRGACCLDIGFRHMFPALALIDVYTMRSGFHRAFILTLAQETGRS